MKRLLFILFVVSLTVGSVFAQKGKPTKGSWSTEVQINPFDQDGETFSLDGLKVRYFFTDKDAFRIKVGFAVRNFKYTDEDTNEETHGSSYREYSYNDEFKNKTGNFKIDLGYERHFNLGKRIDAYLGASVGLGKHFASTKVDTYSKTKTTNNNNGYPNYNTTITVTERTYTGELKNGAVTSDNGSGSDDLFQSAERASFDMNAAIFAGLDFYVYKGIYIGTELGLGCQTSKSLKMEFDGKTVTKTTINNDRTNTEEAKVEKETTDNFRETNFKSYIEPRLRIGITF